MAVHAGSTPPASVLRRPSQLEIVKARGRTAQLHLFTYVVGSALFWTLWAAISVTADHWYWWPIIPFVGWGVVLAARLWHACHPSPGMVRLRTRG